MKNTSLSVPYFNSIKVRLKHTIERFTTCVPTFQFHKGTIKTEVSLSIAKFFDISIP